MKRVQVGTVARTESHSCHRHVSNQPRATGTALWTCGGLTGAAKEHDPTPTRALGQSTFSPKLSRVKAHQGERKMHPKALQCQHRPWPAISNAWWGNAPCCKTLCSTGAGQRSCAMPSPGQQARPRPGSRQLLLQRCGRISPCARRWVRRGCAAGADLLGIGAAGDTGMDAQPYRGCLDGQTEPGACLHRQSGFHDLNQR